MFLRNSSAIQFHHRFQSLFDPSIHAIRNAGDGYGNVGTNGIFTKKKQQISTQIWF